MLEMRTVDLGIIWLKWKEDQLNYGSRLQGDKSSMEVKTLLFHPRPIWNEIWICVMGKHFYDIDVWIREVVDWLSWFRFRNRDEDENIKVDTLPYRPLWGEIRRCHGEPLWSRPQSTQRPPDPRKIWRQGSFRRPSLTASKLHLHVSFWSPASESVHHREERRGDVRCCVCFSSVHNLRPSAAALMLCSAAALLCCCTTFLPAGLPTGFPSTTTTITSWKVSKYWDGLDGTKTSSF